MSYQVIARKFRPQTFHQLVGQDHISQTLLNALNSGRLPHALLFTGPRGTGKTSSARILAKSLRCPNAVEFVPCDRCKECEDIATGRSLDVIEIDGASNNGVEAIRELRETVGYMPTSGKYKVYIIDEVHMLSTSAFNALLKTLEEPPSHVIFIMATTEVQKIPNTILSRCQRFDFRSISARQIAEKLAEICAAESVEFEKEALFTIARQSGGSMRDSQSLLDQIITYSRQNITQAQVIEILGLTDRQLLIESLQAILSQDPQMLIQILQKLKTSGVEPKNFAQDLLEQIRHLLMIKVAGKEAAQVIDASDAEIQRWSQIIESVSESDLHMLFDMILKGTQDLLRSVDPGLTLEVLMLRWASAPRLMDIRALLSGATLPNVSSAAQLATPARSVAPAAPTHSSPPATSPVVGSPATPGSSARSVSPTTSTPPAPRVQTPTTSPLTPSPQIAPPTASGPKDPWTDFVEAVKKSNGFLGALLENTKIAQQTSTELVLEMPERMKFLLDKLQDPENIQRTETFIKTFWNKTMKVKVELGSDSKSMTPKEASAQAEQKKKDNELELIENHPLVKSAKELFKAEIVSIKEIT